MNNHFDAIVVGSGPNGFAAAITLQQAGVRVLLLEGKDEIGGGMRTKELTLPGFKHDVCSTVHPMINISPFFKQLPLGELGLEMISPTIAAAHPFDSGSVATLHQSLFQTAEELGEDRGNYLWLMRSTVQNLSNLVPDLLGPFPKMGHIGQLLHFGMRGLPSSNFIAKRFSTEKARGLWAGMAAHGIQPLTNLGTSAIGMMLLAAGHAGNWPFPKGGAQSLANVLATYFLKIGGKIETGRMVHSLKELPKVKAILMDVTPQQLLTIAGDALSLQYRNRLKNYRYGAGVFKVDWALKEPIPFTNEACREAGTVHLGNTFEEIKKAEWEVSVGKHPEKPFIILTQPTVFDPSRAPDGKHIAWAYCHVPNGSTLDQTENIENQVERFAPGFKELILARSTMNTQQMEQYNANYLGGDINGGIQDIRQMYTRPVLSLSPYRTSLKGLYLCSSSTPPGGGGTWDVWIPRCSEGSDRSFYIKFPPQKMVRKST